MLTGSNPYTGITTVNGGTLQLGSGTASGSVGGNISLSSGASLVFASSSSQIYSGAISGTVR